MPIPLFPNRTTERVLRNPQREKKGVLRDHEEPRRYYFQRLMQVTVRHTYYNGEDDLCLDFQVLPTPSTASLMHSIGLVFKEEPGGFSVFYNTREEQDLIQYLERQTDPGVPGIWTRLSFVFVLTNQFFVNFTNINIKTNPALENFYFTNQRSHRRMEQQIVLHPETFVTERETLEVTPIQVPVVVPPKAKKVKVRAISNEEVLCFPRCFPKELLLKKSPNAITCKDAASGKGEEVCRDLLYINFSVLPEDKYTIEQVAKGGQIIDQQEVLYTIASPVPFCFINLLFTSPTGQYPDHYPVQPLPDGTIGIVPITYEIKFKARSTYWNYFVIPQRSKERLTDLKIKDVTPDRDPIEFAGPCRVTLTNGSMAYRFVSTVPIQLQQHSDFIFQLWGKHGLMVQENILIDRLPVASMKQVLPETKAAACLKLRKSLCPDSADSPNCQTLITQLCPFDGDGTLTETQLDPVPKIQNFSDIFVAL